MIQLTMYKIDDLGQTQSKVIKMFDDPQKFMASYREAQKESWTHIVATLGADKFTPDQIKNYSKLLLANRVGDV